jgi:hypothetical protein
MLGTRRSWHFRPDAEVDSRRGTVDHIAFTIALEDYDSERQRLEGLGLETTTAIHGWVQWRSVYVHDPEGYHVELVCFDPSIEKPQ